MTATKRPPAWLPRCLVCVVLFLAPQILCGAELIDRYENGERKFEKVEIGEKTIVYFHQRVLGEAIVEKDFIVYRFDAATGELLSKKVHWRKDLPEALPPISVDGNQVQSAAEGEVQSAALYIISPQSDVFPIDPTPVNPCWIVRTLREGRLVIEIVDAVDGVLLGYGVPPPYTAFSLTGPQYAYPCAGAWTSWSESADYWFNYMGYSTQEIVWPGEATVKGHVQSSETALFYELAHGGSESFASGCVNGQSYETTHASEIASWIAAYKKISFAFIGSCGGMCDTGPGTLSYEFRKGSSEQTFTVGYCGMSETQCAVCWSYSVDWQNALFDYLSRGWTAKDAFDGANADYPQCAVSACMRFAGDELFAVVPIVVRDPGACLVAPSPIDFGALAVGSFKDTTLTIKNTWEGQLAGTVSAACEHFGIVAGGGPYTLEAGDSLEVTLRYEPKNGGEHRCSIETGDAFCADVLCTGFAPHPIHYVSPYGRNEHPYASPENAAHSIADAIGAADAGDSVFVVSGTFVCGQLRIVKGIALCGAWDIAFVTRSPGVSKTVIDLAFSGSVEIGSGEEMCVIDGFSIQGGNGVQAANSALTIAQSEIRLSSLGGVSGYGSEVHLDSCVVSNNASGRGAGVFLDACTGSISRSVVSNNVLELSSNPPHGGGVHLANCSSFTLVANLIEGNTAGLSGSNGGGLYVENSTGVEIVGGIFSGNNAAFGGGGIHVVESEVSLRGVGFEGNGGTLGGAANTSGTRTVTIAGCRVTGNTAVAGGGLYASGDRAHVDHNLFDGNHATVGGGGCYFVAASGSFIGNTMNQNAGGVYFSNTTVAVVNNIVTNSTGSGIKCAGSPVPAPLYCNSWNNTTNYDGCTPGTGCISLDPLYVDAGAGDYHLGLHSPEIDAGDPDPARNDPDGSRGDMGIYGSRAFVMEQPEYPKGLAATVVSGNAVLTWYTNPEPDVASYAVYKDTDPDFIPSLSTFVTLVAAPDTTHNDGPKVSGTYYKVSAINASGYAGGYAGPVEADVTGIGEVAASAFRLHQNHPNPFNPTTRIRFEVGARVPVTLEVFDLRGALVRRLVNEERGPGSYVAEWDGRNEGGERVTTGVYFYRLSAGDFSETKKMVLLK